MLIWQKLIIALLLVGIQGLAAGHSLLSHKSKVAPQSIGSPVEKAADQAKAKNSSLGEASPAEKAKVDIAADDEGLAAFYQNLSVDAWRHWEYDPALITVLLFTWLYSNYLKKLWAKAHHIPWGKAVAFFLSMASILLSLCSPLAYLADYLFSFHMIEHILLIFFAAPLFAIAEPFPSLLQGVPQWGKGFVVAVGKSFFYHKIICFFFHPLTALVLYIANMWLWHFPAAYNLTLTNEYAHRSEHILFFLFAFAFWWNIFSPYPSNRLKGLLVLPYMIVPMVLDNVLAALITFADHSLYAYPDFASFGMNAIEHQRLGGALMWVSGIFSMLGLMVFLFFRTFTREQRLDREKKLAEA